MTLVRRNFDRAAEHWDERPQRVQLAKDVAAAIVQRIAQTAALDVLDFGCGTGLLTLQLHPLVRSITGVDSSSGMLDILKQKIASLELDGVRTLRCDLEQGDDLPGRYDLVVSSMTFHHIRQIDPLLQRLHAVLVPGGRLCVADLDLEQGRFHTDNTGVFHFGFDREQLRQAFVRAGFCNVSDQTATRIVKPDARQHPAVFPVFLLSGEKEAID